KSGAKIKRHCDFKELIELVPRVYDTTAHPDAERTTKALHLIRKIRRLSSGRLPNKVRSATEPGSQKGNATFRIATDFRLSMFKCFVKLSSCVLDLSFLHLH